MVEQVVMNSSHINLSIWITEKGEKPRENKSEYILQYSNTEFPYSITS